MTNRLASTPPFFGDPLLWGIAIAVCLTLTPSELRAQVPRACQSNDSTAAALHGLGVYILSDTTAAAKSIRAEYGIPAGTSSHVVRVEDATVCEAVTATIEASGAPPQSEALVVVRLGSTIPFYLAAKRTTSVIDVAFVLNSQFKVVTTFGGQ